MTWRYLQIQLRLIVGGQLEQQIEGPNLGRGRMWDVVAARIEPGPRNGNGATAVTGTEIESLPARNRDIDCACQFWRLRVRGYQPRTVDDVVLKCINRPSDMCSAFEINIDIENLAGG